MGERRLIRAFTEDVAELFWACAIVVSYDLTYTGASWEGVVEELERSRDKCPGYFAYQAGLTPVEHKERQEQRRRERLQWQTTGLTAGLSFISGIIGALIGKRC